MYHKRQSLVVILFWLAVWHLASLYVDATILLPSPLDVLTKLATLVGTSAFWIAIGLSLKMLVLGVCIGMCVGTLFAYISIKIRLIYLLIDPIMLIFKAVPVASFIILLLVWFSASSLPMIVCIMMVVPVFYTTMRTAMLAIDQNLTEMAQVFKLTPTVFIHHIVLPQVIPYFLSASTLAIGLGFKSGIACEIIALSSGTIGSHLYDAKLFLDTPTVFAWTAIIITLSMLLEKGFLILSNRLLTKLCEVHT